MLYILGLGTNLGDKKANLKRAIQLLQSNSYITITSISSIYESKALLPNGAPVSWDITYCNMAIGVDSMLMPLHLLQFVKQIEQDMGRLPQAERWAPRLIDIDILIAEGVRLQSPQLCLPHPELVKRSFALLPAAEIAPDIMHLAYNNSLAELAKTIERSDIISIINYDEYA